MARIRPLALLASLATLPASAFVAVPTSSVSTGHQAAASAFGLSPLHHRPLHFSLILSTSALQSSSSEAPPANVSVDEDDDEDGDDCIINIKTPAMERLRELKSKQEDPSAPMILRMGVRSGGCSGMSYVMDFTTEDDINNDDEIDEYPEDCIKCVVDTKSLLYLYGLELDYSDELIGGGFKFFNPNAEEECGCGSSFGV